jgi:ParB family chromosome partitioning protein
MTTLQSIPLNKLVLSDRNVRKTGAEEAIDDLVASIAAHGLLQSLVVQPVKRGKYAVIAGGRRLRALKLLAERGTIEQAFDVPCSVISIDDVAEELSLAENLIRAPMHPADQFEAFRAVIDQGKTIADVAARFNVSECLVERRLKLGRLSPVILQAYRDETLDLEDAQAFALSDNHAEQERVFAGLSAADQLHPRRIRAALTEGEVPSSDKRVRFIGEQAYVAAGGTIRRDLFDDEDRYYVHDERLLETLVAARLSEMAQAVKAEGWQWVQIDI